MRDVMTSKPPMRDASIYAEGKTPIGKMTEQQFREHIAQLRADGFHAAADALLKDRNFWRSGLGG
jgi:hypothetical protein